MATVEGWQEEGICSLDVLEQLFPGVFGIKFRQLTQQFFRLLVARHGNGDLYLINLVSADAFLGCGGHTLFAQTQFLSALSTRWNFQLCASIDGRDLNSSPQCSLAGGNGNGEMNI